MFTDQHNAAIPIVQAGDASLDNPSEDHHLLASIANGDSQAFERLYARYRPCIRSYLRHRLRDPEGLDEVLNDVMMAIWQKPANCPPHVPILAWFYGIARYAARKYDRGVNRRDLVNSELIAVQEEPEIRLLMKDQEQRLDRAISRLPHHERQPVELLIYHGCTYKDIAHRLDTPINTIKARIRRARKRLEAILT